MAEGRTASSTTQHAAAAVLAATSTAKKTATKSVAARPAAKKTAAKKSVPVKAPAKKTTATKAPAKTTAAKAAPAKAAAKKAPATKTPAKTATKAAAAKKTPVKAPAKTAATKAPAKVAAKAPTKAPAKAPAKTVAPEPVKAVAKAPAKKAPAKKAAPVKGAPRKYVVRSDETPWTTAELNAVKAELQADTKRLKKEIALAESEIADLLRDSGDGAGDDQADAGTKTFEREHEMSLANNSRDMVLQNERALARIADGTYGVCESCGSPIGKARLQVFPRATLCVACKQREERR